MYCISKNKNAILGWYVAAGTAITMLIRTGKEVSV
jgi:hypothetical protein